ncbi:MAG: metallophosphoesterase [Haloarculaceae archaeon]
MRFGVISDTHDNVAAIERALDLFEEAGVNLLVHCGDYVAPPTLPFYEGFEVHGVLGNNDGELDGLERTLDGLGTGSELHGRYAELEIGDADVFVLHGDQGKDAVEEYAQSGDYDYVLYGHFHEAEVRTVGETTVVNPGAHFPTVPEADRSVAVVDTEAETVDLRSLQD